MRQSRFPFPRQLAYFVPGALVAVLPAACGRPAWVALCAPLSIALSALAYTLAIRSLGRDE